MGIIFFKGKNGHQNGCKSSLVRHLGGTRFGINYVLFYTFYWDKNYIKKKYFKMEIGYFLGKKTSAKRQQSFLVMYSGGTGF